MNKPSLRDRRRQEAQASYERALERRNDLFDKLVRNSVTIKKLRQTIARLERAAAVQLAPLPKPPVWIEPYEHIPDPTPLPKAEPKQLEIPTFLKRDQKDAAARAEIEATNAERKKRKTIARIAKMKAKDAGELRKMPLTGRAALEAIRKG